MDIRLIALDLDGTLLTSTKTITEHTKKVLKEASDRGIHVVIATGRTATGVQRILKEIPFVRYAILANGALVQDLQTGEVIRRVPLPRGKMTTLMKLAKEKGFYCDCFIDGQGVSGPGFEVFVEGVPVDEHTKQLLLTTRQEREDFAAMIEEHEGQIEKVNLLFHSEAQRLEIGKFIENDPELVGVTSLGPNIEVNHKEANKGQALLELAAHLSLPIETVMAFGDSDNDLTMIETAGAGVAMGNAFDSVKNVARYITRTNDEDGVAFMVEQIWKE